MEFKQAIPVDFFEIRNFYWQLIDEMKDEADVIGWKKGIYPEDAFLLDSLTKGNLYTLREDGRLMGAVIVNSEYNEGYLGISWTMNHRDEEILVPHALAITPKEQGRGVGKILIRAVINLAKERNQKAVRLDILGGNTAAQRLYESVGFRFVEGKDMYYPDTGWARYEMYELEL